MSREPEGRYPTAKELADDLRRFQAGRLVAAYQYSRKDLFKRFVKKNRRVLIAAGAALVLLSTMAVVSVRRIVVERNRAQASEAEAQRQRADAEMQRTEAREKQVEAIRRADVALYAAKAAGRNRSFSFSQVRANAPAAAPEQVESAH